MAFDLNGSQPVPDVAIVVIEDIPKAIPKVVEPALEHRIQAIHDAFQGVTVGTLGQLTNLIFDPLVVLIPRESKSPSKRITQKAKALNAKVNYARLGRV